MGKTLMLMICILILIIIIIGGICVRNDEKKKWNGGYCSKCGLKWMHYDTDSHGGRMYKCNNWHGCNISYNVDK